MKNYYLNFQEKDTWIAVCFNEDQIDIMSKNEKLSLKKNGDIQLSQYGFHYVCEDIYHDIHIHMSFYHLLALPNHSYFGDVRGYLYTHSLNVCFDCGHVYIEERKRNLSFIHAMNQHEIICFHLMGKRLYGYWKIDDQFYYVHSFCDRQGYYHCGKQILALFLKPQKAYCDQAHIFLKKGDRILQETYFDHAFYQIKI